MAVSNILNLLALSSLAVFLCSFVATPANALSLDTSYHVARHHVALAKAKRSPSAKRCKQRPATTTSSSTPAKDPTTSSSTPTATPTKVSSQPAASSGSGGGKVGIAWSSGDDPALAHWATGKASCLYTWSAYLPSKTYGLQGIPMLWGPDKIGEFQKLVKAGYATIAMGFNEPDISTQSHLDPDYAASLWKQYMNPLKNKGYTLISPATVTGTKWMTAFVAACDGGCHFDAVAMHWYGTKFEDLKSALNAYHTAFGKPIWLTEFACQNFSGGPQCSKDQVYSLMQSAKDFLDSTDWVQKYFWFGAMHDMTNVNPLNQLMSSDGTPNALGELFLN